MTSLRIPARSKRGKSLFITEDPAVATVAKTDQNLIVVQTALPEEIRNFLEKNYCKPRPRSKRPTKNAKKEKKEQKTPEKKKEQAEKPLLEEESDSDS